MRGLFAFTVALLVSSGASAGTADAVSFANENQPALAEMLQRLKQESPRQYEAAVQDVDKARLRLERLRERSPRRYALELQRWKLDMRKQVLTAEYAVRLIRLESAEAKLATARRAARKRLGAGKSVEEDKAVRKAGNAVEAARRRAESLEHDVRSLATERVAFDIRRLAAEQQMAEETVARFREQRTALEDDPQAAEDALVQRIRNAAKAAGRSRRQQSRPAAGNKSKTRSVESSGSGPRG